MSTITGSGASIKIRAVHTIIIVTALCFFEVNLYSQARSSIAVGAGITRPLQKGYATGSSWILQASIRLSSKFALLPVIGIEKIRSDKNGMYNGYYFVGSGRSVDLFLLTCLPGIISPIRCL